MSEFFQERINLKDIKTGDHVIARRGVTNKEYKPKQMAEKRNKETNDEILERIDSGQADYDTGYMYVDEAVTGGTYTVKHNLGRIPTRVAAYFSTVEEPKMGKDEIFWVVPQINGNVGVSFSFTDKDTMKITVGTTYVHGTEQTGYLRTMIWR